MITQPRSETHILARVAYEAYWKDYKGNPTPYARLTNEGQLRWIDVAKAILSEANRLKQRVPV